MKHSSLYDLKFQLYTPWLYHQFKYEVDDLKKISDLFQINFVANE